MDVNDEDKSIVNKHNKDHLVTAIGGTNASGTDIKTEYYSEGFFGHFAATESKPYVEFSAPAQGVPYPALDSTADYKEYSTYNTNGSSTVLALAQAAGVYSLLRQVDPTLEQDDLRHILRNTARQVGQFSFTPKNGFGLIDAKAAMDYILENEIIHINNISKVNVGSNQQRWTLAPGLYNTDAYNVDVWLRYRTSSFVDYDLPVSVNINSLGGIDVVAGRNLNGGPGFLTVVPKFNLDNIKNNYTIWQNIVEGNTLYKGNTTIWAGRKLTIPSGKKVVVEDSVNCNNNSNSPSTGSIIEVSGTLVLSVNSSITRGYIHIKSGGKVIVRNQVLLDDTRIRVEVGGEIEMNGATHLLGSNNSILSYGKLKVENSTFNKKPMSKWSQVFLSGSGASGSTFKNVSISGSYSGLQINGAHSIELDNVSSTDNEYCGVGLNNASATVISGTFDDNYSSYSDGFRALHGSYVHFFMGPMSMRNNGGNGVRVGWNSTADFGTLYNDPNFPLESAYADISGNQRGIYSLSYSTINMGDVNDYQPWYKYRKGWNQIKDNVEYNLRVFHYASFYGEDNYWGTTDYPTIQTTIQNSGGYYDILPVSSYYAFKQRNNEKEAQPAVNSENVLAMRSFSDSVKSYLQNKDIEGLKQWMSSVKSNGDKQRDVRIDLLRIQLGEADRVFPKYVAGLQGVGRIKNAEVPFEIQDQYFHHLLAQGKLTQAAKLVEQFPDPVDRYEDRSIYDRLLETYGYEGTPSKPSKQPDDNAPSELVIKASPNPFNPTTAIDIDITNHMQVRMEVYNVLGQRVAVLNDGLLQAGTHRFSFDAQNLASGLYFVQTIVDGKPMAPLKLSLIK